jgi:hypothetical protein
VAAVAVSAALAATGLGASAAFGVTTQHDVRQSDFNATDSSAPGLNDTRSAGHYGFLKEGLHVYTDDATSNAKAAEYYAAPAGSGLPTSGSYAWYGTEPGASDQIVFDADNTSGNGNDYNVLVGEQVYTSGAGDGDNLTDWWLTGGSSATAHGVCPSSAGGSGSDCHGSLADWKAALPNAKVGYYGFSLGSGIKGDGVLRAQTYGDDKYVFTDEAASTPPTTQNVTGYQTASKSGRTVRVDFHSNPLGANTTQGNKIRWAVTIDNSATQMFSDEMGAGENATYRYTAPAGQHVVHIFRDGHQVSSVTVQK